MANDDPKTTSSWMPAGVGYADDLIPKFNGQDKSYSVTKFIQEIEDNGEIFQWTPLAQLVIARRSLTGTAALWLRSERPFKSWEELRQAISKEFPDTLDQKTAHELMSSRKKRNDESYLDYVLIMRELGKRGKMPDYVAIKYIVDGLPGEETHKIMLYGVTTYSDLKEKLRIYETLKEKIRKREVRSQPPGGDLSTKGRAIRCYSCGERSHHSKECPHKHLGLKCFKCNGFGHIAPHCKATEIPERVPSTARSGPSAGGQSGASLVRRHPSSFRQIGTSGERPQDGGASGTKRTMFNTDVTYSPADGGSTDMTPDCYDVHTVSSVTDDGFDVSTTYREVNNSKQVMLRKPRKTITILKSTTSREVIAKLQIHQQVFGNPKRIITDRGTAFTSREFRTYCEDERIEHVTITTGIPRGNGQVERIHRVIISVLTKLCIEQPGNWYKHVSRLQQALNSTYQRSVNAAPFELLLGTKMRVQSDPEILSLIQQENRDMYLNNRDELRKKAKEQILKVQEENRQNFNKGRKKSKVYQVGDLVAIRRTQFGVGMKLRPKYLGPYRVTKVKRDRYDVVKVDSSTEGPNRTSTAPDSMKPWPGAGDDDALSVPTADS